MSVNLGSALKRSNSDKDREEILDTQGNGDN
jgi:hypothetical protein